MFLEKLRSKDVDSSSKPNGFSVGMTGFEGVMFSQAVILRRE